jgi:hypothetical protein
MIREDENRAASLEAQETARMVREEVIFRPARRAAAFCAIVILGLSAATFAANPGADAPGAGFEVRAEIVTPHQADGSPN